MSHPCQIIGIMVAVLVISICKVGGEEGCIHMGPGGTFTSPGHPGDYPPSLNCGHTFEVAAGHIVVLTFTTFETEPPYDIVTIYDGPVRNDSRLLRTSSGTGLPESVVSSGRQMYLHFNTDADKEDKGFMGTYHAIDIINNWVTDFTTEKRYIDLNVSFLRYASSKEACNRIGGYLPEPKNKWENDFLGRLSAEVFMNEKQFFIGMNDFVVEDVWRWDRDNSRVSWFQWARWLVNDPEPNGGREQNCCMMRGFNTKDHWWTDVGCTHTAMLDVVCEAICDESMKRQCIRGMCIKQHQGKIICNCTGTGYRGPTCNIDNCDSDNPCVHGVCINNGDDTLSCDCADTGYRDEFCSTGNCIDHNPCIHGECINNDGNLTCDCTDSGYHDQLCSTDNCISNNPCIRGVCINNGDGTLSCDCSGTGYNDGVCSTDNCVSHNPCIHGECINNGDDTLSCDCSGTGYNDGVCSTDNCVSHNPCVHGVCINNGDDTLSCNCSGTEYIDEKCSTACSAQIDCGIHNSSQHNGSCVCACLEGYTNGDAQTCVDVDECATQRNVCVSQKCVNTEGSFKCEEEEEKSFFDSFPVKIIGAAIAVSATVVSSIGVAMMFSNVLQSMGIPFQNPFTPNAQATQQAKDPTQANDNSEDKNVRKNLISEDSSSTDSTESEEADTHKKDEKRKNICIRIASTFFPCISMGRKTSTVETKPGQADSNTKDRRRKTIIVNSRTKSTSLITSSVKTEPGQNDSSTKDQRRKTVWSRILSICGCCTKSKPSTVNIEAGQANDKIGEQNQERRNSIHLIASSVITDPGHTESETEDQSRMTLWSRIASKGGSPSKSKTSTVNIAAGQTNNNTEEQN